MSVAPRLTPGFSRESPRGRFQAALGISSPPRTAGASNSSEENTIAFRNDGFFTHPPETLCWSENSILSKTGIGKNIGTTVGTRELRTKPVMASVRQKKQPTIFVSWRLRENTRMVF